MATIKELEETYNPENDLAIGDPEVTWCDYELLQLIKKLEKRIAALLRGVSTLDVLNPLTLNE